MCNVDKCKTCRFIDEPNPTFQYVAQKCVIMPFKTVREGTKNCKNYSPKDEHIKRLQENSSYKE